jgi:hypothetical protein
MSRSLSIHPVAIAALTLIPLVSGCRDNEQPAAPVIAIPNAVAFDAEEGTPVGFDGKYTSRVKQSGGFVHVDQAAVKGNLVVGYHYFSNGTTTGGWAWTGTITPDASDPNRGTITGSGTKNDLCCGSINFTLTNGGIARNADGSVTLFYGSTDPRFGDFGAVSTRHGQD